MSSASHDPALDDIYASFAQLKSAESSSAYSIEHEIRKNNSSSSLSFLFFTPHGGGIELHTHEIARMCASACQASYYAFIGRLNGGNKRLHITSTRFDEPTLIELLTHHHVAISFHGTKDTPTDAIFYVGGLMREEANVLVQVIFPSKKFRAVLCEEKFSGKQPENVCNRGTLGKGIQFEMTIRLRQQLAEDESRREDFCECLIMFMKYVEEKQNK